LSPSRVKSAKVRLKIVIVITSNGHLERKKPGNKQEYFAMFGRLIPIPTRGNLFLPVRLLV
jgi:hypothetical protein